MELNQEFIGKTVEILVEGISKTAAKTSVSEHALQSNVSEHILQSNELLQIDSPPTQQLVQLTGHTPCDRIVVFDALPEQTSQLVGKILPIIITNAAPFTLFGKLVS